MTDFHDDDSRDQLDRLLRERGVDYAALSARIGRNPAYIQQYIKRGSPRRLADRDRARIAAFLGVPEAMLGGPERRVAAMGGAPGGDMVLVPKLAIGASAGAGTSVDGEAVEGSIAFDPKWLRDLGADPRALSIIRVEGDSMAPTLNRTNEAIAAVHGDPRSSGTTPSSSRARVERAVSGSAMI